jgi:hypothetical protein
MAVSEAEGQEKDHMNKIHALEKKKKFRGRLAAFKRTFYIHLTENINAF